MHRAVAASRRLYRLLLRTYPAPYLKEWGESMEQLFADCAQDAFVRSGYRGLAALWLRTSWDLLISLAREYRRREWARSRGAVRVRPLFNLTPRAQQALAFARKEAGRLGTPFVGTEHLLLGILKIENNVGGRVLSALKVDRAALRAALEAQIQAGDWSKSINESPITPRFRKALAVAGKVAQSWQHHYVGCEHLLVSLTLIDGLAHNTLLQFGVTPDRIREETLKVLGQESEPPDA